MLQLRAFLKVLFLTFASLLLTPSIGVSTQPQDFTVAVVAQFPPSVIHKHWTPVVQRLSKETGYSFTLKLYQTIPQFETDLLKGIPDFAFMNPYHQVMAKKSQGYIPLIRDSNPLTGILVVKTDGPIKTMYDLNGKEIAFPSPNAFAASLYMRAILTEKYSLNFTPRYVTTHTNVYRHVLLDKASAGGGVNNTLLRQPEEVKSRLKIIFETPPSAPHPFSAHPRVPRVVREAVIEAFLKIANDTDAKDMLNNIQIPNPTKADYTKDYQYLEKLKLERYVILGGE